MSVLWLAIPAALAALFVAVRRCRRPAPPALPNAHRLVWAGSLTPTTNRRR